MSSGIEISPTYATVATPPPASCGEPDTCSPLPQNPSPSDTLSSFNCKSCLDSFVDFFRGIWRLIVSWFTPKKAFQDGEKDCKICLAPLTIPAKIEHCGHVFDQHCIVTWLSEHNKICPACKVFAQENSLKMCPDLLKEEDRISLIIHHDNEMTKVSCSIQATLSSVTAVARHAFNIQKGQNCELLSNENAVCNPEAKVSDFTTTEFTLRTKK